MNQAIITNPKGKQIYIVGIKGTGTSGLAELFSSRGADVTGSDVPEVFYTDKLLEEAGIRFYKSFDANHIGDSIDQIVYSAAYDPLTHPEIVEAKRRGIDVAVYTDVLGALSTNQPSAGISGVHGKTTTTGMCGTILDAIEMPVSVISGAAISSFGGRPVLDRGDEFFVAETCEYRRHFLAFSPRWIVITSVEYDHPDYFAGIDDVTAAFISYAELLPEGGSLIYCADDPGAVGVADALRGRRPDVEIIPYGELADGAYRVKDLEHLPGELRFRIDAGDEVISLHIPGTHNVLNATAAIALTIEMRKFYLGSLARDDMARIVSAIGAYRGSSRRSELVGEQNGIMILDDYGHHPTEIRLTIKGLRQFYPDRRIVVDFMPHTFSRTEALFDEFVTCFDSADIVILHDVYSSAREIVGTVTGGDLYDAVSSHRDGVFFFPDHQSALDDVSKLLRSGDLFTTLGAGDNWKLGRLLMDGGQ